MPAPGDQQRAIKQNPQGAMSRALGFLSSGEPAQAQALCQLIIRTLPGFTDAWLLMCQLQLDLQRPNRALECIDRALLLQPDSLKALLLRAESLVAGGRQDAAREALLRLEAMDFPQALTLRLVANLYVGLGSYQEAVRVFERSLGLDDNDIECWHLYSGVLFAQGLIDEADSALQKVLMLNPLHGEALLTRSLMRKQSIEDNHIQALQGALTCPEMKPVQRAMIHYALAKELDDTGESAASFEVLERGAELRSLGLNYDVARDEAFMDEVIQRYDHLLSRCQKNDELGTGIVFIASLPRAGSTLVDRILASHSNVESLGETDMFHDALLEHARLANAVSPMTFVDALGKIDYPALGKTYLEKIQYAGPSDNILIDKTPNNIQYLGLIHKALPGAKIIHVYKTPMDACYSIYRTYFSRGYGYACKLETLGRYYVAYAQMMAHWTTALPETLLNLSYEQLVGNIEEYTCRLLEHVALDWQAQCLDFHLNTSPTATASVVQVRQPLFRTSLQRWHKFERQLLPLADILRNAGIQYDQPPR